MNGVKTFTLSPVVPTPTTASQVASKSYVDGVAMTGAADATTTTKGLVQLAGDLSGTAASPTVPALAGKEPVVTGGTTSQYYRGDKTFQTLDKTAVGLANVDNTSDVNKPISSATQTALNTKADSSTVAGKEPAVTAGTISQYYRGDKTFQTLDKTAVGLANVDNTSDVNKPVSTATQTALNTKANTSSLATVATTGSYTDLSNRPTIPAAQVNSDWNASSGVAQILNKPAVPSDAGLVHLAGAETITGTKTFSAAPVVATISNGGTLTLPSTTDTLVGRATTDTLTNKTLTQPNLQGSAVVALVDGATITTDASLGNIFSVTLGGNRTLANPTNQTGGHKLIYRLRQDATGSRTVTWSSAFRFGTDILSPTLSTTPNKTDYVGFIYNAIDSTWDCVALTRGL